MYACTVNKVVQDDIVDLTFVFLRARSWKHCREVKSYSGRGHLCR